MLYRSNAQSRVIESALFNASVPYRVYYGGLRFFERAEIARAGLPLRLLENPHDDTSFCGRSTSRRAASARARWSSCCRTPRQPDRSLAARRGERHQPGKAGLTWPPSWRWLTCCASDEGCRCARSSSTCSDPAALVDFFRTEGRRRPHRKPGGTGQRRGELRHQEGFSRDAVFLPLDERTQLLT